MKRIVICCDGTWNRPDQMSGGRICPTNVTHIATATAGEDAAGTLQLVYYQPGVGTRRGERIMGGAFGAGLSRNVLEAYRFLIKHYAPGDELFLFGFSRGAYTARSLVGFIRNSGLLRREHEELMGAAYALYRRRDGDSHPRERESQLFRRTYSYEAMGHEVHVKCLGVWDTVGALGIPIGRTEAFVRGLLRLRFHDLELSSRVEHAFHAVAVDERRRPYVPSLWKQPKEKPPQHIEQVWFAGAHSNVGGGYPDARPSDIALAWMIERARACGLAFYPAYLDRHIDVRSLGEVRDSRTGIFRLLPSHVREVCAEDPDFVAYERIHQSVVERLRSDASYRPGNLPRDIDRFLERPSG